MTILLQYCFLKSPHFLPPTQNYRRYRCCRVGRTAWTGRLPWSPMQSSGHGSLPVHSRTWPSNAPDSHLHRDRRSREVGTPSPCHTVCPLPRIAVCTRAGDVSAAFRDLRLFQLNVQLLRRRQQQRLASAKATSTEIAISISTIASVIPLRLSATAAVMTTTHHQQRFYPHHQSLAVVRIRMAHTMVMALMYYR